MKGPNVPMVADRRTTDLLQRIAVAVEGMREDLQLVLAQREKQSNGRDALGPTTVAETDPLQLLSANRVAALLGVNSRTLREMRNGGAAPPEIVVGHRPRWRRVDVERWLAARRST